MSTTDCLGDCHNGGEHPAVGLRQWNWDYPMPAVEVWITPTTNMIRFVLVIFLRVGFLLVQVGSVPVTNVNLILLQNVVDLCWVSFVYFMVGSMVAYTGDIGGLVGGGYWISHESTDKGEILVGWQAVMIASAICTTSVAGRMHTIGSLIVGGILCGILLPFIIHWSWTANGWMSHNYLQETHVYFRDYGGAAIVHITGGVSGLIGCLVLGRRLLRFREIDEASMSVGSVGASFVGHLFIVLGLQSLLIAHISTNNDKKKIVRKVTTYLPVNNLLTISSCTLIVVALHFFMREPFNHWTVMRCMQAITAGAVIVAAGVDVYTPVISLLLGCGGGILFYLMTRIIFRSALEDYCNVMTTHVICALFGSFVVPIFYVGDDVQGSTAVLLNVAWQIICLISIIGLTVLVTTPIFFCLKWWGLLRNRSEYVNHLRSAAALQRGPSRVFMKRLFNVDGETVFMQPGVAGQDLEVADESPSTNHQHTAARREMPGQSVIGQTVQYDPTSTTHQEQKLRKFRQVHTISSDLVLEDREKSGYTLRRTLNSMNLHRQKLFECDMEIKVLLESKLNYFVNSESESESDLIHELNTLQKFRHDDKYQEIKVDASGDKSCY